MHPYRGLVGERMIDIQKCSKSDCIMVSLSNHVSLVTIEEQKYFIEWMRKEKPELFE